MAYNTFKGSKYVETKHLTNVQIAKLIRADLKAALPGFRFTVRCPNNSIDVVIVSVPAGLTILADYSTDIRPWSARLTPDAAAALKTAEEIYNSYNFDHSEIESDYFHVRYYGNVEFLRELEQAERGAALKALELKECIQLKTAKVGEAEECESRWTALLAR